MRARQEASLHAGMKDARARQQVRTQTEVIWQHIRRRPEADRNRVRRHPKRPSFSSPTSQISDLLRGLFAPSLLLAERQSNRIPGSPFSES